VSNLKKRGLSGKTCSYMHAFTVFGRKNEFSVFVKIDMQHKYLVVQNAKPDIT
jgi:hypothetical protein